MCVVWSKICVQLCNHSFSKEIVAAAVVRNWAADSPFTFCSKTRMPSAPFERFSEVAPEEEANAINLHRPDIFQSFYTTSRLLVLVWFMICFVTCFSDSCGRGHLTYKTRSWATPWDFEDMFTKQWCRLGLLFLCFSRLDGLEHIGKLLKRSSRLICDNWVLCNRSMATWIFESLQLIWRPSWTSHDQSMMTWANCSRRIV